MRGNESISSDKSVSQVYVNDDVFCNENVKFIHYYMSNNCTF